MPAVNALKHLLTPSFRDGFFAGLAAPALLFTGFAAPEPVRAPEAAPLTGSTREALAGDWQRVGDDLRAAMARHGKTA